MTADEWIERLGLEPHPEGGFYRETYRASGKTDQDRAVSTAIYFLLRSQDVSHFHRIDADEMWHFYAGSSLTVHRLSEDRGYEAMKVGRGDFQAVVPAGEWFAATVDAPDSFALVGCTVAPGSEFERFELASKARLLAKWPKQGALIDQLCLLP